MKALQKTADLDRAEVSVLYYAGRWVWNLFRWGFLLCISFIVLYPLFYMLGMSLRSASDFTDITVIWIPKTPTWYNFKVAVVDVNLAEAMKNTALISVGSTALLIFVTCMTGYGFARFRFKGRGLLFAAAVFSIVVPPQMLGMPNYLLLGNFDLFGLFAALTGKPSPLNLLDTPWAYFLPAALGQGMRAGVFVLVFRQYFTGLPAELEEAALMDGCGHAKTFFSVMLPNALTPITVFSLFSLVWYWGDFYTAYINLSRMRVLSTRLMGIRSDLEHVLSREEFVSVYSMVPIQQAACLFSILPLIVLFLAGQRFFVQGIDKSGIVG